VKPLTTSSGVHVRRYVAADAPALFAAVEPERDRLGRWMPWVPFSKTVESFERFIEEAERQEAEGTAVHRVLERDGSIVGGIGASIGVLNGDEAEVGYWLVSGEEGRGTAFATVTALIDWLFGEAEMHRISLRAATGNSRSRAVAERLGFTYEGVLRSSLLLQGRHEDAAVYSVLDTEWRAASSG
jgi:ribosomal-protein-serine acetyltransferase